ncbi:MAG: DUF1553 domain-containing protein [Bacteroidota bacterium]
MNNWLKIFLGLSFLILLASCSTSLPEEVALEYNQLPQNLDFNIHVKPILSDKCYACHGPDNAKRSADLRLDIAEYAYGNLKNNPTKVAIKKGDLNASEVYQRIITPDASRIMPPPESNLKLTDQEKAILAKWIEDGAEYKPHWAFTPPEKIPLPESSLPEWEQNPIDRFVAKKLKSEGLQASKQAEKEMLLRRVSLDLTGLPPTELEINDFLADNSKNAYEKQVDRLLQSPHYGEKMAIDWMDLARYADTHGYTVDFYRDVSPWRDWVIQSFNDNLGYDDFIKWQLAGDLLPNATRAQILATTFNRLHPQNLEDGIIDEEFRVEYVADRVAVFGQGFMGLSLACARCHDHKFDPISQQNFYEFFSFFNNINEAGLIPRESATPVPTLLLPTEEQEAIIEFLEKSVAEQEEKLASDKVQAKQQATDWIAAGKYQSISQTMPVDGLLAHYTFSEHLKNRLNARQVGKMARWSSKNEVPNFVEGKDGQGLLMDGDAWLDLDKVGIFQRKDKFSIGLWVNLPNDLEEGVIFHKCKGTGLHAYRGFHLYLKDNKLEVRFAHTWPDNAISKTTIQVIPKNQWVHLMLTYNGSSKADGIKLYLDGQEMAMEVEIDNLYKDIIFFDYEDVIYSKPLEPGIRIGGRWRGVGIKGGKVDEFLIYNKELSAIDILKVADPAALNTILATAPSELSSVNRNLLEKHYLANTAIKLRESQEVLQKTRETLFDSLENVQEIMVMKEMETPRKTYILERGLYDNYGEEVFPNVPENIHQWKEDYPKNRLGLAQWLTDPKHPLTSRVAVNRYWQNYFGRGLVASTEDFGNQGALPSHPELLDWLAQQFIESGWDVKALQKMIVMSASYQQSSICSPDLMRKDPENILLARGPSVRLSSEMVRDNALAASGLLNRKIGGESVRPYQPAGLWKMNGSTYQQDSGENLYRRSIYTLWKRTVPNPTLATFDQPERTECTVRRQKTNTPLQALVLLNDPTYVEVAKVIGEEITKDGSTIESIEKAYQKITGLTAPKDELEVLKKLQVSEYEVFKNDELKKQGWLSAGEYQIDESLDADLVAANAIVASVILNSDASITKR